VSKNEELIDLQCRAELKMAGECYQNEKAARQLGTEHKCVCGDPLKWTKEQCEEYLNED